MTCAGIVLLVGALAQVGLPGSVRTPLSGPLCTALKSVDSARVCPGAGGTRLEVIENDSRTTINLIQPNGTKRELRYWDVVTRAFSNVVGAAEWRVDRAGGRVIPRALIVRIDSTEMDEQYQPRKKAYLAIAKITAAETCVTDKLDDSPANRRKALELADGSASRACLKAIE